MPVPTPMNLISSLKNSPGQSAGAVEYTDCISADE